MAEDRFSSSAKRRIDIDYLFNNFDTICNIDFDKRPQTTRAPKLVKNLHKMFDKLATESSVQNDNKNSPVANKRRSKSRKTQGGERKTVSRDLDVQPVNIKKKLRLNLDNVFGANTHEQKQKVFNESRPNRKIFKSFFNNNQLNNIGDYNTNNDNKLNTKKCPKQPFSKIEDFKNALSKKHRTRSMSQNANENAQTNLIHQLLLRTSGEEGAKPIAYLKNSSKSKNKFNKSIERNSHQRGDTLTKKNLQLNIEKRLAKRTSEKMGGVIGSGSTRIPTSSRVDSNKRSTQNIQSFLETETKDKDPQHHHASSVSKKQNLKDKNESYLAFKKKPSNTQRIFKSSITGLNDLRKKTDNFLGGAAKDKFYQNFINTCNGSTAGAKDRMNEYGAVSKDKNAGKDRQRLKSGLCLDMNGTRDHNSNHIHHNFLSNSSMMGGTGQTASLAQNYKKFHHGPRLSANQAPHNNSRLITEPSAHNNTNANIHLSGNGKVKTTKNSKCDTAKQINSKEGNYYIPDGVKKLSISKNQSFVVYDETNQSKNQSKNYNISSTFLPVGNSQTFHHLHNHINKDMSYNFNINGNHYTTNLEIINKANTEKTNCACNYNTNHSYQHNQNGRERERDNVRNSKEKSKSKKKVYEKKEILKERSGSRNGSKSNNNAKRLIHVLSQKRLNHIRGDSVWKF